MLTSRPGRERLRDFYRDSLLEDTCKFWFPRCLDEQHGGFLHFRDADGSLLDSDKSIWAQGRMSWMLLTLYNEYDQRPEWLTWAESGLRFLERFGFDADGRMFFHVTQDGRPLRKRRYAYSEAFAAVAWSAHYRATGNAKSAEQALRLFKFFTEWNFTPGLMPPKSTDVRPMIGLAPRMITIVTAQELRSHLGDDAMLTQWIDRAIDEIERWFVKHDLEAVMESVSPTGEIVDHCDGRMLNPGHAIEGAWFILREGTYREDSRLIKLGGQMLDYMWQRGWDNEHGGILYFCDVSNRPPQEYWHDMKFWWPHNETIIATLLAYLATGDEKYAKWHSLVHDWSHAHFADPINGEWWGYLHRDGTPSSSTKGNLWKSFFHHPRMQWVCYQALCSTTLLDDNGGPTELARWTGDLFG